MRPPPVSWTKLGPLVLALTGLSAGCNSFGKQPVRPPPVTRLLFGGDVMLSRNVGLLARLRNDPAFPFRGISPLLHAADIAFVNLESPFSDQGAPVNRGMIFKAQPSMVQGLVLSGIDVVSLANNHARDQDDYGLAYTLSLLARYGIAVAGAGRTQNEAYEGVVLERNGVRFGFLAFTYDQLNGNHQEPDHRIAMLESPMALEAVRRLRTRAHVVIVSMHAGAEYAFQPDAQQVRFARSAIDAGAQLVIGHHPHVVQPVEAYREGVICYSLGNLIFDQYQSAATQRGLLAEFEFRGSALHRFSAYPVEIPRSVPRLAAGTRAIVDN